MIIEDRQLRNKYYIFESRHQAGSLLASFVAKEELDILFIIPNGGIPIGVGLLEEGTVPKIPFDLLIVRKIQIPWNTEAGMGAVTPDGQIFLNEQLLSHLSLSDSQLEQQITQTKQRIEKLRNEFQLPPSPPVEGKKILLVDDGIASGFSMLAGTKWLKSLGAKEVLIAVPTAPMSSLHRLEPHLSKIICLNIRDRYPFAVADAYQHWYDLSLNEAKQYITELQAMYSNFD